MKETIKQLEREVEKIEEKDLGKEVPLKKEIVEHINLTLEHCKLDTKLQTLKDVCEEIKKVWAKKYGSNINNEKFYAIDDFKEELLRKFQGEEI